MFVDEAQIELEAGDGGAAAFRRESTCPRRASGGDGGDGGGGGSSPCQPQDLAGCAFSACSARPGRRQRQQRARRHRRRCAHQGAPEPSSRQTGDLVAIWWLRAIAYAARGRRGSRGNPLHHLHQPRPAPRRPGEPRNTGAAPGLKLLADVGLVGLPSAGKSSLLTRLSKGGRRSPPTPSPPLEPYLGGLRGRGV